MKKVDNGEGLTQVVPLPGGLDRKGRSVFEQVLQCCASLPKVGAALLWLVFNSGRLGEHETVDPFLRFVILGKVGVKPAMHRSRTSAVAAVFPLPIPETSTLHDIALRLDMGAFCTHVAEARKGEEAWLLLSIAAVNGVAGVSRAIPLKKATKMQAAAHESLLKTVGRSLDLDCELKRSPAEAEKELSSRFLNYTGEEVPKMQVATVEQIEFALPPQSHAGSIRAVDLVSSGTKWFLENPDESLIAEPPSDVKLTAKVHIAKGEELDLCKLLVARNICTWIKEEEVLVVRNRKVLNGMFAVGKGSLTPSGKESQRLIMNLIPTNSVLRQAQGAVSELPAITQYLSLVLDGNEDLAFYQSDMSSAFYLFKIPPAWSRMMAFSISFEASVLGLPGSGRFHLACGVIPMGWSSAVSVMQEIAVRLTTIGRLPLSHQIRKGTPLPPWLVECVKEGIESETAWYHVYLDNFCAMEKTNKESSSGQGQRLHEDLEEAWDIVGVLSSAKKRVSGAEKVQELGAWLDGSTGYLGGSPERLLKLIQTTMVVVKGRRLKKKWVQVVAGRWVHVLSFRRPGMVCLEWTWKFVSCKGTSRKLESQVKSELFGCCCACFLFHTNLRADISDCTTASDASMTGGAVGASWELSQEGQEFVAMDKVHFGKVPVIPVMVISLFNGIGCTFRCYDLCGVVPAVSLAYEISGAANRVTARRWPHVQLKGDVRELTQEVMKEWKYLYPGLEEIHLWAGFPCTDLSAVRAGRKNLLGPESGLFWEFVRIRRELQKVFKFALKIRYFGENVASMDASASDEISRELGSKPLRMDSSDIVPIHRPRFCWTNVELVGIPGVDVEERDRWYDVTMHHEYPVEEQWIEEGAIWPGGQEGEVLPTAMKSIRRQQPPWRPAGIDRVGDDAKMRWEADEFRYPPYQYADRFIFWVGSKWRLASASERELLHGLGYEHTSLCWSASDIKRDPVGYEDCRKSLVGDSFNCFSFVYVAALACHKWIPEVTYDQLWNRMGLAPGWTLPLHEYAPLQRRLCYGSSSGEETVVDLHRSLLRRTNHTGSDVRVSSGKIVNPKSFPRQSVAADWWKWKKVFAYRWARADHINNLELRSIIHSVEWRIRHLQERSCRICHISDSYVCISIISKGRTSSAMLRPLLQRLSAWLLTFDLHLVICHVESSENPTDDDSRA